MCAMNMLCKTGTAFPWVAYPHLVFELIGVRTIRTHMCRLLPEDLALALKQVLSLYSIPILLTLLSGGHM